jgi:hypothetical protein
MQAVIFGRNNKKRKLNEAGLDDLDEGEKRRRKLMEERLRQLQDSNNLAPEDFIRVAAEAEEEQEAYLSSKQRE